MRLQLQHHVFHLLRLDRQHDDIAARDLGTNLLCGSHAKLLLQLLQRIGIEIDHVNVGACGEFAGQAAN